MHLLLFFAGRSGIDDRDSTGDVGGIVLLDGRLTFGAVERDNIIVNGIVLANGYLTAVREDSLNAKYRGPASVNHDVLKLGSFKLGERKLGG